MTCLVARVTSAARRISRTNFGAARCRRPCNSNQAPLLGKTFFPNLISSPFLVGLHAVFALSAAMCIVAAIASLLRSRRVNYGVRESADALPAGADAAVPAETAVIEPAQKSAAHPPTGDDGWKDAEGEPPA